MDAKRQQGRAYQLTLDFEGDAETPRHDRGGDDGIRPARPGEPQTSTASDPARALTDRLMEEVCRPENLNRAYRRVKANQGAPGVDGMTIAHLRSWLAEHEEELIAALRDGSYRPQPVRGVQIPKPGGGVRQLGIPTAVDRLVQRAILQVLEPLLDPTFSPSGFGSRPGRGAHDALKQAKEYVADGRLIVVDVDLEKFFDSAS
jgi:RNA-directed DNA polymerase